MNASDPSPASPGTYTPGYAGRKLAVVFLGLLLVFLGLTQAITPLRLVLFGGRAKAEAVRVVKVKEGLPPRILASAPEVEAQLEPRDRSYTFWNEFRFQTEDGRVVEVRAPVGSQLRPLYPLIDDDGLPTSDLVVYDRRHPEAVAFPWIVSTWFAPGMLIFIGLVGVFIGAFLFYWAEKPIDLPRLPVSSGNP